MVFILRIKWSYSLKVPYETATGERIERTQGVPQGSLCEVSHKPPYAQCIIMHSVLFIFLKNNYIQQKHCA